MRATISASTTTAWCPWYIILTQAMNTPEIITHFIFFTCTASLSVEDGPLFFSGTELSWTVNPVRAFSHRHHILEDGKQYLINLAAESSAYQHLLCPANHLASPRQRAVGWDCRRTLACPPSKPRTWDGNGKTANRVKGAKRVAQQYECHNLTTYQGVPETGVLEMGFARSAAFCSSVNSCSSSLGCRNGQMGESPFHNTNYAAQRWDWKKTNLGCLALMHVSCFTCHVMFPFWSFIFWTRRTCLNLENWSQQI